MRLGALSQSDEVWNNHKHCSQYDEQNSVGNEIGEDHQGEAAGQRHDRPLPFAPGGHPNSSTDGHLKIPQLIEV